MGTASVSSSWSVVVGRALQYVGFNGTKDSLGLILDGPVPDMCVWWSRRVGTPPRVACAPPVHPPTRPPNLTHFVTPSLTPTHPVPIPTRRYLIENDRPLSAGFSA